MADPLTVKCPVCGAAVGSSCVKVYEGETDDDGLKEYEWKTG